MTLTEFLTMRLDEDEAYAEQGHMMDGQNGWHRHFDDQRIRHEIDAKRAIVDLHEASEFSYIGWYGEDEPGSDGLACATCGTASEYAVAWPCLTLLALASPYADHPDYRQEWKPWAILKNQKIYRRP